MKDTASKKIKAWGGIVEYEEPTQNARAEAIRAAIDAGSSAFEQHKEKLLAVLRNAHKRGGPRSRPFDPDKTWRQLTSLAQLYFWRGQLKQETMLLVEEQTSPKHCCVSRNDPACSLIPGPGSSSPRTSLPGPGFSPR